MALPIVAGANSAIPPTVDLQWAKRTYETVAPPPFGQVKFSIAVNPDGRVLDLGIWISGKSVPVKRSIYADLSNPSEIDLGFSNPSQTNTGSVEYIGFYFEVGEYYQFELGNDVPGCAPPCLDTARDIVEIRINADMSIQRKTLSLRKLWQWNITSVSSSRSKLRRTAKPLRVLSAAVTGVRWKKHK